MTLQFEVASLPNKLWSMSDGSFVITQVYPHNVVEIQTIKALCGRNFGSVDNRVHPMGGPNIPRLNMC